MRKETLYLCSKYKECPSEVCKHKKPHQAEINEHSVGVVGEIGGDEMKFVELDCTNDFCDEARMFGIGEAICLPVN